LSPSCLQRCALGGGVLLGQPSAGLRVSIDVASWRRRGGQPLERAILDASQSGEDGVAAAQQSCELVELAGALSRVGELCLAGDLVAASPGKRGKDGWFCTGDICTVDDTGRIWFLGRMQQAVPVGGLLGSVPPVAVEMVCMQTHLLQCCALVGIPQGCKTPSSRDAAQRVLPTRTATLGTLSGPQRPIIVLRRESNEYELRCLNEVITELTSALASSVWAMLLDAPGFCFLEYPGTWPVDSRHSSKTDRMALGCWAAKITFNAK